ncbi:glycosyltransferase [Caballeronia sp. LP006]|uniref:glycosyltransferase family 2 protein n=1 Tax=Caballeronia sp. LP006 TaxID=3038552 RepID=UPI0028582F0F|nr:glycosyltransferase [Caballeronia sp. LP006]MDR5831977.1 glycosyltransferase [Caballeronia sp. LP006]
MFEQEVVAPSQADDVRAGKTVPCLTPASFWTPLHIVDSAWHQHAPFAFWLMEAVRPSMLVELGTHAGFSFLAFCQAIDRLHLPTSVFAIDTWEGDDHAGFYGEHIFQHLGGLQGRYYSGFSRMIRARFDEALVHFADGEIDLLHIDGRHGYDDVLEDYTSWLPKLSERAVVLFHDINVRERDFGVWRLWDELQEKHPAFEFVHGHGLGVLCPCAAVPAGLRPLFEAQGDARAAIRNAYSRLGGAISTQFLLEQAHASMGAKEASAAHLREQLGAVQAQFAEVDRLYQESEHARQEEHERFRDEYRQFAEHRGQMEDNRLLLEARLGRLENEHLQAAAVATTLKAELIQTSELVSGLRGDLAARNGDLGSVNAELARTRNELSHIKSSTTWRALGVVRSVGSLIPLSARQQMRKGAKALYWALTPHKMPARLRFLRARDGGAAIFPTSQAQSVAASASTSGTGRRTYIDYRPATKSSGASGVAADTLGKGNYALVPTPPSSYVYIPPRRPDHLDPKIEALRVRPSFSIVVPLYNTPDELFRRMIGSVLSQWYPHWELILVDDKSPQDSVRELLATLRDARIKTVLLEKNKGISGATNEAIDRAMGDYIVFLDHDDELTDDCLFELAQCIATDQPDYVYSDEDKIMPDGRFAQPFFKPDWSPDTMMSTMYTCHVSCVKRSLLEEVGGLRSEFDGSQDWDFVLRVVEKAKRISHVPKVLYHWRVIPASVASDLNAKPYAIDAARRARVSALERRGLSGTVVPVEQLPGYFRVKYDLQGKPLISIIIPSRDNGTVLRRCLDTIFKLSIYPNYEVVLLDNGSKETQTVAYLESLQAVEKVRVIRHDAPFNYSEINNIGAREAKGSILLFLNDDTEVLSPTWLADMAGYAQLKHIGAVGAKLLYPETRQIQHSGVVNLSEGPNHAFLLKDANDPCYFVRNLIEYNWIAVTGACLMVERSKFEAIGGFDETFPLAYNDVDLCFGLLEHGLYNVVCPAVQLLHHESLSRGLDQASEQKRVRLEKEKRRLYLKHPHYLMHDPFHNPNLLPDDLHFTAA